MCRLLLRPVYGSRAPLFAELLLCILHCIVRVSAWDGLAEKLSGGLSGAARS